MQRKLCLALGMALCLTAVAQAVPTIDVGNHFLLPNTPGQIVQIFVTGGDPVQGMNFNAQVADGGPVVGGMIAGPGFTGDILTGTIFALSNTGENDLNPGFIYGNQLVFLSTTTNVDVSDTVPANGLLATLTFDTTGFFSGTWSLLLAGTLNGDTDFPANPLTLAAAIQNGSISIVPEPSSIILGLFAAAGLGAVVVRKQRARRVA